MRPVQNKEHNQLEAGSRWLPIAGGGFLSTSYGYITIVAVRDGRVYYHYQTESIHEIFNQELSYFRTWTKRMG
jgi:hypothetical protein